MSPACLSCVFLPTLDAAGVLVSPGDRDGGVDESESACVSGSKNFRLFWPFLPPVSSSPALVCECQRLRVGARDWLPLSRLKGCFSLSLSLGGLCARLELPSITT